MTKLIPLRGKWAVGEHAFTIVDEQDYPRLSAFKWKAKWNGARNNCYAVRNVKIGDSWKTIRMHREVLRLREFDGTDVDHINHNALDNRRENLRTATRSENMLNARVQLHEADCVQCGMRFKRERTTTIPSLCVDCSNGSHSTYLFVDCEGCGETFVDTSGQAQFCSDGCRFAVRRAQRVCYVAAQ
jgi:predicted Zn-ribbon and HTH transcriptional regulator